MKKRTSIHDIAKSLGVSATAVSFVLNGKARSNGISHELEKRVLDHIQEIGYQPNLTAKSLRTGKSYLIAMLVESISDPFFSSLAKVVETESYQLGYKVFFASTENETLKAKALINTFRDRQVDGYIIAPPPGIEADIQTLTEAGRPVVIFDRALNGVATQSVLTDNYEGSYDAMQHLLDNGYRRIGFVTLESDQSQMIERYKAYENALNEQSLALCIKTIPYNIPANEIVSEIENWLSHQKQLDAVFFSTNYLTLGGIEAIKNLGLVIPDNLAIVSFDDSAYFKLNKPSITVVAQPVEEIARKVVKTLMEELERTSDLPAASIPYKPIVIPSELVVRESSPVKKTKAKKNSNHLPV